MYVSPFCSSPGSIGPFYEFSFQQSDLRKSSTFPLYKLIGCVFIYASKAVNLTADWWLKLQTAHLNVNLTVTYRNSPARETGLWSNVYLVLLPYSLPNPLISHFRTIEGIWTNCKWQIASKISFLSSFFSLFPLLLFWLFLLLCAMHHSSKTWSKVNLLHRVRASHLPVYISSRLCSYLASLRRLKIYSRNFIFFCFIPHTGSYTAVSPPSSKGECVTW